VRTAFSTNAAGILKHARALGSAARKVSLAYIGCFDLYQEIVIDGKTEATASRK
jgi:hypothetical protein